MSYTVNIWSLCPSGSFLVLELLKHEQQLISSKDKERRNKGQNATHNASKQKTNGNVIVQPPFKKKVGMGKQIKKGCIANLLRRIFS